MQKSSKIIDKNPLVSVVICAYNGEHFIEEQLETVCLQSYTNLEIIIADDCSTDSTRSVIERFAAKDKRIRLFSNEKNKGYNQNFNYAVGLASGEIIAFCDQDDIWEERKIEILLQAWPEKAALIYADSVRFLGKLNKSNCKKNSIYRRFEGTDPRKLSIYNTVSGHALMIKKELLEWSGFFPQHVFYDWRLAVIAAVNGGVAYVDQILVYQRIHQNNVSFGDNTSAGFNNKHEAFHDLVSRHLSVFLSTPNMSDDDQLFFKKLAHLWGNTTQKKSRIKLFLFLMKYRKIIFWYKRKKIDFFSHLKHSFLLSYH